MSEEIQPHSARTQTLIELLPALQRLDGLLARAVAVASFVYDKPANNDRFRGLYINESQVAQAMMRVPASPTFAIDESGNPASLASEANQKQRKTWLFWRDWQRSKRQNNQQEKPPKQPTPPQLSELPSLSTSPPFAQLQREYQLSEFELDLLLVALGGRLDNRYGLVYAYLQDNVGMRQPTVELVLNLICANAAEKLTNRTAFHANAPLIREHLISLKTDKSKGEGLLSQTVVLDGQIVRFLLAEHTLDPELAPFCTRGDVLVDVDDSAYTLLEQTGLEKQFDLIGRLPPLIYLEGKSGVGKQAVANALVDLLDKECLRIDCKKLAAQGLTLATIKRIEREVRWLDVTPVLLDADHLFEEPLFGQLCEHMSMVVETAVFTGQSPWQAMLEPPLPVYTVRLTLPTFSQRVTLWEQALAGTDLTLSAESVQELASRYRLNKSQINHAALSAEQAVLLQNEPLNDDENEEVQRNALITAVHAQFNHNLGNLAKKITPLYTWNDIVLPADAVTQLRQICLRIRYQHHVWGAWGFDKRLSQGKGINILFSGSSGTGKTMAAEIIANELGYELYKIDLSGVVSKYIGETEKNLNKIFEAAESASAVLFFDEADSLFGKRSEVRDAHDRYANIEISYLLQKMEAFEGLSILATNLKHHLDDAFIRRLTDTIHFPFPDSGSRADIWRGIWPESAPVEATINFDQLAETYQLSGGAIKNAALTAAFLAAAENDQIRLDHLYRAIQQEYVKMGRPIAMPEQELMV